MTRPSFTETYMRIAEVLARRSTCPRGSVGCLLVRDSRIIVTGYNGSPARMAHCDDVGCDLSEGPDAGCQRAIHAEVNVLAFAARHGVSTGGAAMYTTHAPCRKCAQLLIAAGVKHVFWAQPYRNAYGLELLSAAGVGWSESPALD